MREPIPSTHVADVAEYGSNRVLVFRQSDGASVRRIGRVDAAGAKVQGFLQNLLGEEDEEDIVKAATGGGAAGGGGDEDA